MSILSRLLSPVIDKRIASFQSDLMSKHITEVENIYRQMRGWRHDYHNHIQTVKAHLRLEQYGEIATYLDKLDTDLTSVDTVIKTGNVMVDAILNSKISLAASKNIAVDAKAIVPKTLSVSEIDLCIIIGNLLDNASEACMKFEDPSERFIRVYIDVLKDQLYISVSNSVGGEVRRSGNSYISTKDKDGHGFGLMRVDKIAEKYGGFINRQSEVGVFATEIMLPLR
jgi:Signal transduction histidine kinase regulating citrate/malate metabolism